MADSSQIIRELNDRFRTGDTNVPGRILLTSGVLQLAAGSETEVSDIVQRVRQYDDFDEDNDPFGQHDFGVFEFCGERLFWKIDHYDPDLRYGSEDPANPVKTIRVLTILLAGEY